MKTNIDERSDRELARRRAVHIVKAQRDPIAFEQREDVAALADQVGEVRRRARDRVEPAGREVGIGLVGGAVLLDVDAAERFAVGLELAELR